MREILFRGKRLDNGEWIEGYFMPRPNETKTYIVAFGDCVWYEVDHSTVGQHTGLKDKNGTRIFEGDIIKTKKFGRQIPGTNRTNFNGYDVFVVIYGEGRYEIDNPRRNFICAGVNGRYECGVIGNIHDNPELMKGRQDNG